MSDLISVVILNWNGGTYIRDCLDSIFDQDYSTLEIIVVDNASTDGSQEIVRREYRDVTLICNQKNLGFGRGNNIGIRRARGDYILVLNNDAELEKGCISAMKEAIDSNRIYGACASKILLKDDIELVDAAGIAVFPDGLSIGRGRLEPEHLYDKDCEVFFASGCCGLYKKEMLEDIKVLDEYYDEDFFAYADDTDLGWRARLRGWECVYTPAARVYHLHSRSVGTYSPLKAFLVERNRIWLQMKCFPVSLIFYGQCHTCLRYLYQAYGAFTGRGASGAFSKKHSRRELFWVLVKAYVAALKGFFLMIRKRKAIQRRKKITTRDIIHLLKLYGIGAKEMGLKG